MQINASYHIKGNWYSWPMLITTFSEGIALLCLANRGMGRKEGERIVFTQGMAII